MLQRLSKYTFQQDDGEHLITYSQHEKYMSCHCPAFIYYGKCDPALEARAIIEGEGLKVIFRRPLPPTFIRDIKEFKTRIQDALKVSYGSNSYAILGYNRRAH